MRKTKKEDFHKLFFESLLFLYRFPIDLNFAHWFLNRLLRSLDIGDDILFLYLGKVN